MEVITAELPSAGFIYVDVFDFRKHPKNVCTAKMFPNLVTSVFHLNSLPLCFHSQSSWGIKFNGAYVRIGPTHKKNDICYI